MVRVRLDTWKTHTVRHTQPYETLRVGGLTSVEAQAQAEEFGLNEIAGHLSFIAAACRVRLTLPS
jgi:hypothetical protein